MESSLSRNFLAATIGVAMFTACGGSGTGGIPNTAAALQAAQNRFAQQVRNPALSGEYTGRLHEGRRRLKIQALLSQSQSALGGVLVTAGSQGGLVSIIAWTVSGNTISGNGVGPARSGSGVCTFSMTGTYKHRRMSGSYTATYGCIGETATFALRHKCYFKSTASDTIRPEAGVKPC